MDLSPKQVIVNYILSIKGKGTFLPYSDYMVIDKWLQICPDPFTIILTLDDLLKGNKNDFGKLLRNLSIIDKKLTTQLKAQSLNCKTALSGN